ncbi:hypothetical protein BCU98_00225 [Vibrio splendidus]|nr:hypothetical protein BCU98_00225 [Vibrio splendidus]
MTEQVMCKCDKCKRDILVGETRTTLVQQKEFIQSTSSVQPLDVSLINAFCSDCADKKKPA